jgi:hypothetical protein
MLPCSTSPTTRREHVGGHGQAVLQHPEDFVADLAIVGMEHGRWQRDRHNVEPGLGLVNRGRVQPMPRLGCVRRFGDAAAPGHIGPARQRCKHADQPARRRACAPLAIRPDEVVGPAVGDNDQARAHSGHRLPSGEALQRWRQLPSTPNLVRRNIACALVRVESARKFQVICWVAQIAQNRHWSVLRGQAHCCMHAGGQHRCITGPHQPLEQVARIRTELAEHEQPRPRSWGRTRPGQ